MRSAPPCSARCKTRTADNCSRNAATSSRPPSTRAWPRCRVTPDPALWHRNSPPKNSRQPINDLAISTGPPRISATTSRNLDRGSNLLKWRRCILSTSSTFAVFLIASFVVDVVLDVFCSCLVCCLVAGCLGWFVGSGRCPFRLVSRWLGSWVGAGQAARAVLVVAQARRRVWISASVGFAGCVG